MSLQWINVALSNGPEATHDYWVYFMLCNFADESATCYPSLRVLVKVTRLSESSVARALARLVKEGWVERLRQGDGREVSRYRVKARPSSPEIEGSPADDPRTKVTRANRGSSGRLPSVVRQTTLGSPLSDPPTPPNRKNRHLTVKGTGSGSAASSPAQAPAAPPVRGPSLVVSHRAPIRAAAKRHSRSRASAKSPAGASANPQTTLPLSPAPRKAGLHESRPGKRVAHSSANSVNPPQDARFDTVANILRNEFWVGVHGMAGPPCPWNNRSKAALSGLLRSWGASNAQIGQALAHRVQAIVLTQGKRGAISPSAPFETWLEKLPSFAHGPINGFGDALKEKR